MTIVKEPTERITMMDLYELGLNGRSDSARKREKVGNTLHIGYGSAKAMCHRLNCLGISRTKLEEVLS